MIASGVILQLIGEAERSIALCDDGNKLDGDTSVYDDSEVVGAVRQRLDERPELTVECFFSSNDDTAFVTAFGGDNRHPRVKIHKVTRQDVHFKIIDGGRKAYVSAHPLGSTERNFRMYDCTWVAPPVRKLLLGHYVKAAEAAVV